MRHSRNIGYILNNTLNQTKTSPGFASSRNFTLPALEEGLKNLCAQTRQNAGRNEDEALYHRYSTSMPYRQMFLSEFRGTGLKNVPKKTINDYIVFITLVSCMGSFFHLNKLGIQEVNMSRQNQTKLRNIMNEHAAGMYVVRNQQTINSFLTINNIPFCSWDEELGFYIPMCQFPFEQFRNTGLVKLENEEYDWITTGFSERNNGNYDWNSTGNNIIDVVYKNASYIYLFFNINFPNVVQNAQNNNGNNIEQIMKFIYNKAVAVLNPGEIAALNNEANIINNAIDDAANANNDIVNADGNYFASKKGKMWFPGSPYPFTDKVLVVKSNNTWLPANVFSNNVYAQGNNCYVITPVNKYFVSKKGEAGVSAVRVTYDAERNTVTATYNGTTKEYKNNDVLTISEAPAMAIYPKLPDNMLASWKKFYFYKSENNKSDDNKHKVNIVPGYIDAQNEVKTCDYGINVIESRLHSDNTVSNDAIAKYEFKYCESNKLFEFIRFECEQIELGYIFFSRAATRSNDTTTRAPQSVKVAIDFGSTNTTMRIMLPGSTPNAVDSKSKFFVHLSYDTDKNQENNKKIFSRTFHLYNTNQLRKLPTYSQLFRVVNHDQSFESIPMLVGRALELDKEIISNLITKELMNAEGLASQLLINKDLKLQRPRENGKTDQKSVAADVFLRDCMELLLLNSVANGCLVPKFYASYPNKSSNIYTANKKCWESVAKFLNELIVSDNANKIQPAETVLEAVSVAAYKHKIIENADNTQKIIIVDIGGGTTDISLIQNEDIYTTSYVYAGNDILRNSIGNIINKEKSKNPFSRIFEPASSLLTTEDIDLYDLALQRIESFEKREFILEHCLGNSNLKTNKENLSDIVRVKYLASLFYLKKWIELHKDIECFNAIDQIDFVGGGSISFGKFFDDNERLELLKKTVSSPAENFICNCSADADKPEVVEGMFYKDNVISKTKDLAFVKLDGIDDKVKDISKELFDFLEEMLALIEYEAIISNSTDVCIRFKSFFGKIAKLINETELSDRSVSKFANTFDGKFNVFQINIKTSAKLKQQEKTNYQRIVCEAEGKTIDATDSMCTELDLVGFVIKAFAEKLDGFIS